MKNSTIVGIGGLALAGVGAYLYIKSRKAPIVSSVPSVTPPTNDIKALADLGVKIEEPKVTPYVAPSVPVPTVSLENIQKALLALNIDQTRGISELSSTNYIEAKKIADDMREISSIEKNRTGLISLGGGSGGSYTWSKATTDRISLLSKINVTSYSGTGMTNKLRPSFADILSMMTKKVNALGYKVLPNFDIEKM
jgi:hypothetical protein